MQALIVLIVISLAALFYAYLGYAMVLFTFVKVKRMLAIPRVAGNAELPEVTLIVAAYNEQECIREKIENSLQLIYPVGKLSLLFVTDGSTDKTNEYILHYPQATLAYQPTRRGKLAAVDRVMKEVKSPITVFTDANTLLNRDAIVNLVRHFANPAVGAVAGEKRVMQQASDDASAAGEGMYWKYESKLKQWDSELYSVVGAAGELFAIRTSLYETVPSDTLIEDFVLTMGIAARGYRVVYECQAYALETASLSVDEEMKRKVRIAAGGLQAVVRLRKWLNPLVNPILTFQYVSHRVLRWTVGPLMLVVLLVSSALAAIQGSSFAAVLLVGQLLFYTMAAFGYQLEKRKTKVKALYIPLYFTMMNLAVFMGFWRLIKGRQSTTWEKAQRKLTV